jgi:hypothetical protein
MIASSPLFRYTPKFCFWDYLFARLPVLLVLPLWLFFASSLFLSEYLCIEFNYFIAFSSPQLRPAFIPAFLVSLVWIILIRKEQKSYKQTEFLFFKDKLTWKSKGLTFQQGALLYKDINTIELKSSLFQSWHGVSDLRLSLSSGEAFQGNHWDLTTPIKRGSYIHLFNLPNAQEAYEQVTKLVNDHKKNLS